MESYYLELKLILANPKCVDKKVYDDYIEKLNLRYTEVYPKIISEEFNEIESHLLNNLLNEVNFNNLKELTLEYETEIIRRDDFSENQKNRLLNFISQFKFGFFFSSFILCKETKDWDGRFDNCVRRQLNSVFANDGNPVPETLCVAGMPESWFGTVATCAWQPLGKNFRLWKYKKKFYRQ